MQYYISLDIGGTYIKYGIFNEIGAILLTGKQPTMAHLGGLVVMERVKDIISTYRYTYGLHGICISSGGIIDFKKGVVLHASPIMPQYAGIPIKDILEAEFKVACWVENDVKCMSLAESLSGAGKDINNVICLTIGTGIGGSWVHDGTIYHGVNHSAFEIGYLPMLDTTFGNIASTQALVEYVSTKTNETNLNGECIIKRAVLGDAICLEGVQRMTHYLAQGLATMLYLINPSAIILGGGIMQAHDYLLPLIRKELDNFTVPYLRNSFELKHAHYGNDAGIIGAYYHFHEMEQLTIPKCITYIK